MLISVINAAQYFYISAWVKVLSDRRNASMK